MKNIRILLTAIFVNSVILISACASLNDVSQTSPIETTSLGNVKTKSEIALIDNNDEHLVTIEEASLVASYRPQLFPVYAKKAIIDGSSLANKSAEEVLIKKVIKSKAFLSDDKKPCFYVMHYEGGGWLILSADERQIPVLAYSDTGTFNEIIFPQGLAQWLIATKNQIDDIRADKLPPHPSAEREWKKIKALKIGLPKGNSINQILHDIILIDGEPCNPAVSYSSNGPLMQTQWDQGRWFNTLLPTCSINTDQDQKVWAGCVTIAVAQAIRYYNYPARYNWAAMPNSGGTYNNERATFIKDVFYSLNPGVQNPCSTGTGVWMGWVPGAIKNTFNFSSAIPETNAINTWIIGDNVSNRVTIMSGFTGQSSIFGIPIVDGVGHAWVCHGVRGYFGECFQGGVQFYINWGWGGAYDGWFAHNDWNPDKSRPVTRNFQYFQQVVRNIQP